MAVKKKTAAEYHTAAALLRSTYPDLVYDRFYHCFNCYPGHDNMHKYLDPDTLEVIPLDEWLDADTLEPVSGEERVIRREEYRNETQMPIHRQDD